MNKQLDHDIDMMSWIEYDKIMIKINNKKTEHYLDTPHLLGVYNIS